MTASRAIWPLLALAAWSAGQAPAAPARDARLAPALVVQSGHNGRINALAFSPDGRRVASGSADHTIRLWDTVTGRAARVLTGDLGAITALAFSPDGRVVASGSDDDTLVLWDLAAGHELHVESPVKLNCLVFSPDGALVATCGGGPHAAPHAWSVATGQPVNRTLTTVIAPAHGFGAAGVAFWLDDQHRLKLRDDSLAQTLTVSAAGIAASAGSGCCTALGASPRRLALATADGGAAIYDLATQQPLFTLPPPAAGESQGKALHWSITAVEFSPNGAWLLAEDQNSLRLFDARSGQLVRALIPDMPAYGSVNVASFSADDRFLAEASGDAPEQRDFRLWTLPELSEHRLNGFTAALVSMALSGDGAMLASAADDGRAALWDLRSGRLEQSLDYRDAAGHPQPILAVALNHDGSRLALLTADSNAPIALVDTATGALMRSIHAAAAEVNFFQPEEDEWPSIEFFGDDAHLLTCSRGDGALLWSLASGKVVKAMDGAYPCAPAGRTVAVLGDGKPAVLHPFAAAETPEIKPGLGPAALGPEQHWFAWGSREGEVELFDLTSGANRKLSGHTDAITALAFSPTGELASGSADNSIKLWDPATGRERAVLVAHTGKITALRFAAGGRWLFSASSDGSVRLWDLSTKTLAATLLSLRGERGWSAVAPNGLFDGSDNGTHLLVAWRLNRQLFAPDRFYADFYTPHLLSRTFGGENLAAPEAIASIPLPPAVRIISPASGASSNSEIQVEVGARDQGGGLVGVRLYQNGKIVGRLSAPTGDAARGFGDLATPYRFHVTLVPGDNELRAVALARDESEGNDDSIVIRYQGPAVEPPALHVLAIGINHYQDSSLDLGYARPDADAIAAFFRAHATPLFASVDVQSLTDGEATRANISAALARLASVRPQDVVVIYLAGHGITVGEQFYFLPADVEISDDVESGVASGGISAAFLDDALYRIPALKQLLVIDACQSGGALPLLTKAVFRAPFAQRRAENLLAHATGIYLISAALRQQYAVEVPALHHGVLTYALLSGLGEDGAPKAEMNRDGFVTVEALVQYVKRQVPLLTREYSGGEQNPIGLEYGTDFPLVMH